MRWKNQFQDSQSGFVLVFMSLFLAVALCLVFCFGSSLLLLRNKMESVQVCRMQGLKIQTDAKNKLQQLLALNPKAILLRTQKKALETAIVAALASGQLELVATLKIQKRKIILEQKILDRLQKSILQQANTEMASGVWTVHQKLNDLLHLKKEKLSAWVDYSFAILTPKTHPLALTKSDQNLAPLYRPKKDFENKQAIHFVWLQKYNWKGLMKITQQVNNNQKSQCRVTLEENTWKTKIQKDRLL